MARIELSRGAWIDLELGWLPPARALSLQALLTERLIWEQRHIVLFGKHILQPRLIAWMGDLPYRYSGQTLEPRPWPHQVSEDMEVVTGAVAERVGVPFNHVLVNRYRSGRDSMGYHADDEPELGPDPGIACLSLGGTRRFAVRAHGVGARARPLLLELEAGSLLVMGGTCQRHYRHSILREPIASAVDTSAERISLTFRRLLRPPQ